MVTHVPSRESKNFDRTPLSSGTSNPRVITKNFYVLCFIFFFLWSAFQGLANLESSINCEGGLGVISLSLTYGSLMISSFFLPSFMVSKFGPKWTIFICSIGYIIYYAANYISSPYTLYPAAIIMGASGGPLLTAQAAYVTTCGYAITERNRELSNNGELNPEVMVAKYFGIFFFFFEVTQVSGNAISSLVLSLSGNGTDLFIPNGTISDETRIYIDTHCGAQRIENEFDDSEAGDCAEPIEKSARVILISIYILLGLIAALLCFFLLDNIQIRSDQKELSPKKLILSTIKHAYSNRKQQLLIVLTMYSGFKQAFLAADLTEGYIGCALGTEWIGFILIGYGVIDSLMSWFSGLLSSKLDGSSGRRYLTGFAFGLDLVLMTALLLWRPYPTSLVPFFWISMLYGTSDAIFQTQLYTMYGILFNNCTDAAFANFRFWEALGFAIAYGYQSFLETKIKCYIMLGVIFISFIGYTACELKVTEEKKRNEAEGKNGLLIIEGDHKSLQSDNLGSTELSEVMPGELNLAYRGDEGNPTESG